MSDRVFTMRHARVKHACSAHCGVLILPGQDCYAVTIGGGGLGSLKFPDYVHLECKDAYLAERQEERLRRTT